MHAIVAAYRWMADADLGMRAWGWRHPWAIAASFALVGGIMWFVNWAEKRS